MLQPILIVIIVAWAVAFSVWKLMPARRRLGLLLALDSWAATRPGLAAWRIRALKPRIARAAGSGCDGCAANDSSMPPPR